LTVYQFQCFKRCKLCFLHLEGPRWNILLHSQHHRNRTWQLWPEWDISATPVRRWTLDQRCCFQIF